MLRENPLLPSPVSRMAIFPEASQAVACVATFANFEPYGFLPRLKCYLRGCFKNKQKLVFSNTMQVGD